jgi:hypothetical protein
MIGIGGCLLIFHTRSNGTTLHTPGGKQRKDPDIAKTARIKDGVSGVATQQGFHTPDKHS